MAMLFVRPLPFSSGVRTRIESMRANDLDFEIFIHTCNETKNEKNIQITFVLWIDYD